MKTKLLLITIIVVSILSSCKKNENTIPPLTVTEINQHISEVLKETGTFDWENETDLMVWSAIVQGEGSASVGYSKYQWRGDDNSNYFDEIDEAKENVVEIVLDNEDGSRSNIILDDDDFFTHITFKIEYMQTVTELRQSSDVRFFEPNYDKYELK